MPVFVPAPLPITQAVVANPQSEPSPNFDPESPAPLLASPELVSRQALPPSLIDKPLNKRPRPALLAGEDAREFERGGASWYGPGFHGKPTASGERYDMHAMTAAHRTLPFGTLVRVLSLVNGREIDVRITDRGPFSPNRVIDLSRAAAQALGMLNLGLKEVVLLVPESAQPGVQAWSAPKKQPSKRSSPPSRASRLRAKRR